MCTFLLYPTAHSHDAPSHDLAVLVKLHIPVATLV